MRNLFLFFLLAFTVGLQAQDLSASKNIAADSNLVIVNKDPRVDMLIKIKAQINEETSRDARRNVKGFRLLVINTNKRDEAIAAKTKVYAYFPELKSYLSYQSPFFRLKVGNFKTKEDAENYRKRLNLYFRTGVFIMRDIIEVTPEKFKEEDWEEIPRP